MLIVKDQRTAQSLAASALTLCLFFVASPGLAAESGAAIAQNTNATSPVASERSAAEAATGAPPISALATVSFRHDGQTAAFVTTAPTVAAFLTERGISPGPRDYVSLEPTAALVDGATIVVRSAVKVRLALDGAVREIESAAPSIGELLAEQHVALRPSDEVIPAAGDPLAAEALVRIVRVDSWTSRSHKRIAPVVKHRVDAKLLVGKTRTLDAGAPGVREVTLRFVKRGDAEPTRLVLASRVVRAPRARIVVRGIATYESLARVAHLGFASALAFASSALHMLATAYTAACSGCSGVTASGVRAGYGVIAVDPSIIPLGTHLFIPGYGRAVAGDTGGAIVGSRVDLGFDSNGEALRWGRRPVTVYVLK